MRSTGYAQLARARTDSGLPVSFATQALSSFSASEAFSRSPGTLVSTDSVGISGL